MNFDELAKYHSLSLMRWDEDFYASENTQLAKAFYEAGQQSLQAEIDELNLKINRLIDSEENIARSCKGWRDAHRELDERIIKALDMLEGREGKVLFEDILDVLKGGTND